MLAKETCFLLKWLHALFQLLLIIAHLILRLRCNQSFFVGRRCYIVPVCLYSPRSSNPLNWSSLKFRRAAAAALASPVLSLPAFRSSGEQIRWEREQGKGRALSLNRHWIGLQWIADVLCNYTHIEPFRVDLSYFKLHWSGPPYWLKAASIYLNNKCGD